ncbi:hypothetical protein TwortDSMZ_055 [Staphylococcus phage Twort]|uniref:LysM domain-containing protein n=2 Tax=Staphylococcus phage Twort (strain DSM 17442 / HER 48) TaxID=2908167 RepID=A0A6H0X561_BPTWO|nr:lysM motif protein [Staphylococcus phage Twort]AAX92411.1 ORF122 [Staphylococcus phage Twort]QIW89060.1 hypothetical protein TwortDSMZ_055 [Staphylococcus phage Twort]
MDLIKDLKRVGNKFYHEVKPGETLWTLSKKYGVCIDRLQELNGIKSVSLTGFKYCLIYRYPIVHIVDENDTLKSIAEEYNTTVKELEKLNKDISLIVGSKIIVGY